MTALRLWAREALRIIRIWRRQELAERALYAAIIVQKKLVADQEQLGRDQGDAATEINALAPCLRCGNILHTKHAAVRWFRSVGGTQRHPACIWCEPLIKQRGMHVSVTPGGNGSGR